MISIFWIRIRIGFAIPDSYPEEKNGAQVIKKYEFLAVFRIRIRPDPKLFGLKDPDPSLFHTKLRNMFF